MSHLIRLITGDERGQGLAEYALILALIAVFAIGAVVLLGGQIDSILTDVANQI
jgi:pilus assembly protein Flp/PilA